MLVHAPIYTVIELSISIAVLLEAVTVPAEGYMLPPVLLQVMSLLTSTEEFEVDCGTADVEPPPKTPEKIPVRPPNNPVIPKDPKMLLLGRLFNDEDGTIPI